MEEDGGWALVPHKLVGGLEQPPDSLLSQLRRNARKAMRFRQTAKRELKAREQRQA